MFKPRFKKRSSIQPFKPLLINVALGYIEKKKIPDGSIAAFFKKRSLSPTIHKRNFNPIKHGYSVGGVAFY